MMYPDPEKGGRDRKQLGVIKNALETKAFSLALLPKHAPSPRAAHRLRARRGCRKLLGGAKETAHTRAFGAELIPRPYRRSALSGRSGGNVGLIGELPAA
uniref:Uncharacterized protein n=1 Tax=Rhizobium leguminosarum TaxID=384 RepID=A0A179BBI0_RHILE|nr:hypothetical protein A4U53_33260 [Rhizobium leguminosarum]